MKWNFQNILVKLAKQVNVGIHSFRRGRGCVASPTDRPTSRAERADGKTRYWVPTEDQACHHTYSKSKYFYFLQMAYQSLNPLS